jgi:hypothetical protein
MPVLHGIGRLFPWLVSCIGCVFVTKAAAPPSIAEPFCKEHADGSSSPTGIATANLLAVSLFSDMMLAAELGLCCLCLCVKYGYSRRRGEASAEG